MLPIIRVFIFLIFASEVFCSRVKIEKNGYKNILVSLPRNIGVDDRPKLVRNLENTVRSSSVLLQMATKGRAYFSDITFLVPHQWKISDDDLAWKSTSFNSTVFSDPRSALTIDEADVVVTDHGQYPHVLHQGGCGLRGVRIVLPADFLLRNYDEGVEFLRLWSEYRYGVFPEGGFRNDERYPYTYRTPDGSEEKTTGCSDKTFWSASLCNEGDKQCSDTSFTSSLMDQHLSSSATLFCEGSVSLGPRHNPGSSSKHNLLCKEEGTWFTVMKSPDFSRGRNAAPKHLQHSTDVAFRFVREASTPRVIVAIDMSQQTMKENRFIETQASFYQFVYSTLPYGSELTLLVFGGEEGAYVAKNPTVLKTEDSRILYVESQPLPEEPSETGNISMSQLFDAVFQVMEDSNDIRKASPDVIIVTTEFHLNISAYEEIKQKILDSECRLHVMLFPDSDEYLEQHGSQDEVPLQRLVFETGGELISLHADTFRDMCRGFSKSIGNHNKEIMILNDYLGNADDKDLEITFLVDESLSENLKISLSFPDSDADALDYGRTVLQTPSGGLLNFMRMDFLFAWYIDMAKPEIGEYILKTRRMDDVAVPVLVTVTGKWPTSEDPIEVDVWAETLNDFEKKPQPVRLYAEVRKGWNPVRGASVIATVKHSEGETSEFDLLDDGLGDVDITKDDGLYGRYFTNFTSPGYYNVYVKVVGHNNHTEVVKGPDGFCCGSFFSAVAADPVDRFRRVAGPFSFKVPHTGSSIPKDIYPPSRVTDLRLNNMFDRICVLHWTAAGDDFDSGFAEVYELKVFRDMTVIRNRFSGSSLEVYREIILATPEALYGTTLNHAFELPDNLKGGMYYIAVRAIDDDGNVGESSNIVPVFIEQISPRITKCGSEKETCENGECEKLPVPEKLKENGASFLRCSVTAICVPTNIFVPILSLLFSLTILNII